MKRHLIRVVVFVAPGPQYNLIASDNSPAPGTTIPPQVLAILQRHGGRWNEAFCDGHVEHKRGPAFFDWTKDDVLKLWSRDNQAHRQ